MTGISREDIEAIRRTGMLDEKWYLEQYPDVKALGMDPIEHYLWIGARLGRPPNSSRQIPAFVQGRDVTNSDSFSRIKERVAKRRKYNRWDVGREQVFLSHVAEEYFLNTDHYKNILVSVVLPTYNRDTEIEKAISSIFSQTHQKWELIIVDDGSNDRTEEIICKLLIDQRIKYIKQENKGVSAARNVGLERSSGRYIFYLDSDNVWSPLHLQALLVFMEKNNLSCAYSGLEIVDDGGEVTLYRGEEFIWELCRELNYIDLNSFAHRRELVDGNRFDEDLRRLVDWDFILRLTRSNRTAFAPFVGVAYYGGDSGNRITQTVYVGGELTEVMRRIQERYATNEQELRAVRSIHPSQAAVETFRDKVQKAERTDEIVSIVTCVYGRWDLTSQCLESLFSTDPGVPFEMVVVNNGDDDETRIGLKEWSEKHPNIRVVYDGPNLNFAGGCNFGARHARGEVIVFLNNDTEVKERWLARLIEPLGEPSVLGTQPKLIYPDGTIQGAGLVFSDRSCLPYPIYAGMNADIWPIKTSRRYQAITAACMAVRARDFEASGGFDELFVNGQEDVDLCLRMGSLRDAFVYVPGSEVIHYESKSSGRSANIQKNRIRFHKKWSNITRVDDQSYYAQDGTIADKYAPDHLKWADTGYATFRPTNVQLALPNRSCDLEPTLAGRTIAIKIGCPRPELKEHWGDYHFAESLAAAFGQLGVNARIDFLKDWEKNRRDGDINLVLRGLSKFEALENREDYIWIISHPEKVNITELRNYKHVFVASEVWGKRYLTDERIPFSVLHQCTDKNRFYPREKNPRFSTTNLLVANSRKIERRVVRQAKEQSIELQIYGEMWEGIVPPKWVKGNNIRNIDLGEYYSNADVVLNDHWDTMLQNGFLSNRIFDALACGASIVTDVASTFPADIMQFCTEFSDQVPLKVAIERAKKHKADAPHHLMEASRHVLAKHTFNERARVLLDIIRRDLAAVSNVEVLGSVDNYLSHRIVAARVTTAR